MAEVYKYRDRDMSNDIERLEELQEELSNIIDSMRGRASTTDTVYDEDSQNVKEDMSAANAIANKGKYHRRKRTKKEVFVSGISGLATPVEQQ